MVFDCFIPPVALIGVPEIIAQAKQTLQAVLCLGLLLMIQDKPAIIRDCVIEGVQVFIITDNGDADKLRSISYFDHGLSFLEGGLSQVKIYFKDNRWRGLGQRQTFFRRDTHGKYKNNIVESIV
jgi:hypothetical protein